LFHFAGNAFLRTYQLLVSPSVVSYLIREQFYTKSLNLQQFHGYLHKYPKLAFLFLLACLGVSGFPITPTFIGEDLMFTHIHENQAVLAFFRSLSSIIDGLTIIRIYARIFLGPYEKSMYEMAYRSYLVFGSS
jgi:NADH-quinone oxidoreductase subunit L